MAIWQIEVDSRDATKNRRDLQRKGFVSANYYSSNGFDVNAIRALALAGKIDALRCVSGRSTRWYYFESQVELARLRGEFH